MPQKPRAEIFNTPISKNPTKNQTYNRLFEDYTKTQEEIERKISKSDLIKNNDDFPAKEEKSRIGKDLGLSEKLIEMVKEKERALAELKQNQSKFSDFSLRKNELKSIAKTIKMHYSIRNVRNMFYVNVIEYIITSNQQQILAKGTNIVDYY